LIPVVLVLGYHGEHLVAGVGASEGLYRLAAPFHLFDKPLRDVGGVDVWSYLLRIVEISSPGDPSPLPTRL
jgi:hypothetical protein